MMEQNTISEGFRMFREFGPVYTIFSLLIVWEIVKILKPDIQVKILKKIKNGHYTESQQNACCSQNIINKQDEEIKKIRGSIGHIYEKINLHGIELERRATYDWAEKNILPKLEALNKDLNANNVMLAEIRGIINANTERLKKIEGKVN